MLMSVHDNLYKMEEYAVHASAEVYVGTLGTCPLLTNWARAYCAEPHRQRIESCLQTNAVPISKSKSAAVCPDQWMYVTALHAATVLQTAEVKQQSSTT